MSTPDSPDLRTSTLTEQELEAAHRTSNDLGPGYPQVDVPEFIRELYLSVHISTQALRFSPDWTREEQRNIDSGIQESVASFLQMGERQRERIRCTFSGSVALNRAMAGVMNLARSKCATGVDVVTTSPSIDIMGLFLGEYTGVTQHYVNSRAGERPFALDVRRVLEKLLECAEGDRRRLRLVLLTSPENPTGCFWRADELLSIAEACAETNSVLLLDHCFLLAGIHDDWIPRIWDVALDSLDWIGIWDTGKTFGLNEDKLGFICTGGPQIGACVDEALDVIQFGISRRQKIFFTELLRSPFAVDYIGDLRRKCKRNIGHLVTSISEKLRVITPPAGSLVLIDCSALERTDEEVRKVLLHHDVGVIAGRVFFHGDWRQDSYLRIALAREPEYFRKAFGQLQRVLVR